MNTVRMNITLPSEIVELLKPIKNKSNFIAGAIKERIERDKKKQLVRELTEGYSVRKSEDKKLSLEWDTTTGDGID